MDYRNFFRVLILWLALSIFPAFAATYFENDFSIWQDGEYLIWNADETLPLDPNEFCLSLRRANSGIGKPTCRELGEWQRDTVSKLYGTWLKNNLEDGIAPELLRARSPMMQAKIGALEDKIVIFIAKSGNDLKVAIFDETEATPKSAGSVPFSTDKVILGDAIASKFLKGNTSRRLTKAERIKKATEPDAIYQEEPKINVWTGASVAYSQARIPFTPSNWYDRKLKSRVSKYRITRDSLSLWNFLEDETIVPSFYWGVTWFGVFGAEIFYKYSNHDMKIDKADTSYTNLDHWSYSMHEIGLSIHITRSFRTAEWLTTAPFAYAGFQYAFLVEDIELKDDSKESLLYDTRITFDDTYKGGVFGVGTRFILFKNYGVVFRAGVATRGIADYTSPDADAGESATTIGKITVDGFISAGLEYHWLWR